jgi:C-terminal processing protease CtpA/Prc
MLGSYSCRIAHDLVGESLGIGIAGGQGGDKGDYAIYINQVLKNSVADLDGRINRGDQIVAVNGSKSYLLLRFLIRDYSCPILLNTSFVSSFT